jgi:hypothetical protein
MIEFPKGGEGRRFGYIDAMPGSGKTELFVSEAGYAVTRNRERLVLHIYAAPTVQLLVETYNRLILNAKARRPKTYRKFIKETTLLVTMTDCESLEGLMEEANYSIEPPVNALHVAMGVDSIETYESLPLPRGAKRSILDYAPPDSGFITRRRIVVLFVTHEALLRVRKEKACPDRVKNFLKRTMVWFDEARQCFAQGLEISKEQMSEEQIQKMYACVEIGNEVTPIDAEEVVVGNKTREVGFFPVTGMLNHKAILEKFGARRDKDLPPPAKRFFEMLKKNCSAGRSVVFVRLPYYLSKEVPVPIITGEVETFVATRPTDLFQGYGSVVLLSAMFRDSQMYHILTENRKHTMYNLLAYVDESPDHTTISDYLLGGGLEVRKPLREIKKRSVKQSALIAERLRYIALTATGNLLSRNFLNNSVLVPRELEEQFAYVASKLPNAKRIPRHEMITRIAAGEDPVGDKDLCRALQQYMVPPLWVAMRKAAQVLREEGCNETLLFINSLESHVAGRLWLGSVDYLGAVRNPQKFLHLEDEHLVKGDEGTRQHPYVRKWLAWLEKAVHEKKFFTVPKTTSVRGLNTYKDYVGYIHLAALNQTPVMYEFCKTVIPRYDVDLDNVIDNIMQTLYRTNLRDPDSSKRVYMVLHSQEAVFKLSEKIGQTIRPLRKEQAPMAQLNYRGEPRLTEAGREGRRSGGRIGGKIGGLRRRKYLPEDAKIVQTMQMRLSRGKKRGEDLSKLEAALEAFKTKATKRYKASLGEQHE